MQTEVDSTRFLPTTLEEARARGWASLDVVLVTGDTYIDSPFIGAAVIGRVLEAKGYRVGIIAQPDVSTCDDIARLGEPLLFWGVTAGSVDSLVANRTASGRPRRTDDYTPGGDNTRRPDRACIVYSNLIRRRFKRTAPIVLGGLEASLRRVAHYDVWSDRIRRSILFDAKADFIAYGMADRTVALLASALRDGKEPRGLRGLCYAANACPPDAIELPDFERCRLDKGAFTAMFHQFYRNTDPVTARVLAQRQDTRFLVMTPPPLPLSQRELDAVHDAPFTRDVHPLYAAQGEVRALDTIRFSIATHRGCYGECNFCAIAVHQGRTVTWRSERSILAEARALVKHPAFKGTIQDVGGPTANMYGFECPRKATRGACADRRCLFPTICPSLPVSHAPQLALLRRLRAVKGVRQVVVASGLRHDLVLKDLCHGEEYLRDLAAFHVSGQLKIAPEHTEPRVLAAMGKPPPDALKRFKALFDRFSREAGRRQYLTYYLIAAHPGCAESDMCALRDYMARELHARPEQVQLFTPAPSTYSTLMYWTGRDAFSDEECFVERSARGRERQKSLMTHEEQRL